VGGRVVFPHSTPDYFGEFAAQAGALGARIIGGCCGTTPAQIEAIRGALDEQRRPRMIFEAREPALPEAAAASQGETELARALREGEWVVSVELDPPKGGTSSAMIAVARTLRASGHVGFVDVNDNPMARARMNALMASVAIQRETGIETIPHVTPRDTTVMGLEGVLLGAHAEGVRNILAVTGDPPQVGDYPGSRGVYEIDSIGLVHLIARLNQGEDYVGKAIDQPTSFFTGVAVNPTADDLALELARFEQKIAAGARFAMTQALFDAEQLQPLLDRYSGSVPIPVLVGVWPLRSYAMALRLHNEVPGISVPARVLEALRDAGSDAPAIGLALARELVEAVRTTTAGIYVIPPFKQPQAALELFETGAS
jgi:homocysteine S-methyltransferase